MRIHRFKQEIYPYTLWIVTSPDSNKLSKIFTRIDNGKPYSFDEKKDGVALTTAEVYNTKSKEIGSIIMLFDKIKPGTMAHEACHFTDLLYAYIGEDTIDFGSEVNAYLTAWVVDRIDEVNDSDFKDE